MSTSQDWKHRSLSRSTWGIWTIIENVARVSGVAIDVELAYPEGQIELFDITWAHPGFMSFSQQGLLITVVILTKSSATT